MGTFVLYFLLSAVCLYFVFITLRKRNRVPLPPGPKPWPILWVLCQSLRPSHAPKVGVRGCCCGGVCFHGGSVLEEIRVLVRALASAKTKVNLGQLLHLCNVNALGRVMMGKRVFGDCSGAADPQADEFKLMVAELLELSGVFNIGDFIPALEWLDLQGVQGKMKKFDKFLSGILEEHKIKNGADDGKVKQHGFIKVPPSWSTYGPLVVTLTSETTRSSFNPRDSYLAAKSRMLTLRAMISKLYRLCMPLTGNFADGLLPEKLNMEEGPGLSLHRMEPLMVHPRPEFSKHAYSTRSSHES
ncbi:Transmembrane protein adipocyte-associated 1 isoform 1 [Hibiscus syriacus]|uniref:Transmembrane protein adipocyte-associated 1 isoform 1 n=1 Tax=Hibiscus syriacus TaxID=106335 RepID=A0A6A3CEL3_HIBSY|nr:Transmembrane protein adipocyte-associated 1 isoform 1 [Hibiscus syriacus]